MRGKRVVENATTQFSGITPADAGKTDRKAPGKSYTKDHPRGCGENFLLGAVAFAEPGITPADAGKTLKRSFRNQPFCS